MRTELVKIADAADADNANYAKSEAALWQEEAALETELLEESCASDALEAEVEATKFETHLAEEVAHEDNFGRVEDRRVVVPRQLDR